MAPVVLALRASSEDFSSQICVTGQHRRMLDQVMDIFGLHADIDLEVMKSGQTLTEVTASILVGLNQTLLELKPDLVLVHGDTSTTLAAAIACFYLNIPIGHVEAGLRTHDLRAPFPEEFNRKTVSSLAELHFAPSQLSKNNLVKEGIAEEKIWVTGNTVIDSLVLTLNRVKTDQILYTSLVDNVNRQVCFDINTEKYILITGHRRENFGAGILGICTALKILAMQYPDLHFVYPVHLNPNVLNPVNDNLSGIQNIHLIAPLDYLEFSILLDNCYIVMTDSGGLQEEAPSLNKPVLVMRETTERPEALVAGTVKLVGTDASKIVTAFQDLVDNHSSYAEMARSSNPYGTGNATSEIISAIKSWVSEKKMENTENV
jgi:UDP-N-acetylglucosamine 2-epimerase (non-hydrolysing)